MLNLARILNLGLGLAAPIQGGGPPAYTPLSLGSKLLAWWSADRADLMTFVGSQVSQWLDSVSAKPVVQSVSSRRPLYGATSFNGVPGLTFDGSDDNLENTNPGLPSGATPSRVFAVVSSDSPATDTGTKVPYARGGATNQWRRLHRFATNSISRARAVSGNGSAEITASDTTSVMDGRHLYDVRFMANRIELIIDSGPTYSNSVVPSTATGTLRIGSADTSVGNLWQGQVRHILETTDDLTTQELSDLKAWLTTETHQ